MYLITYNNLIIAKASSIADCIEQLEHRKPFPTVISIKEEEGTQYVTISNNLWINKQRTLTNCYSSKFTRREILTDIAYKVCLMNGYTLQKIEE